MTGWPILSMLIAQETDVVVVRQRARHLAERLGFDRQDQTRIATAVSEIARNAYEYARGGKASFSIDPGGRGKQRSFVVTITDKGPGIADVDAILEGRAKSRHGMGAGITGAKRLVDTFRIASTPGLGTEIELGKKFSKGQPAITAAAIERITTELVRAPAGSDVLSGLADQNRELLANLDELRSRQEEMARLNRELEDTNRGVVALYAELDQRAEELRQASELKSRFLSNMSHEFRTPVNSIMALAELLIDRSDGDLTAEQEKQVGYIKRSAESLAELVNDLLDIAKVEAGKLDVRPSEFTVAELFGGLRGALKPLQKDAAVDLIFEPPPDMPKLFTDETKVGQIMRNLISNALKFTPSGEVRVSASFDKLSGRVLLGVRDTGIGIARADHVRIFEEFAQIESPMQKRVKGTGLGLPLSRRLAELLHGDILVDSDLGRGSTFTFLVPHIWEGSAGQPATIRGTARPEAASAAANRPVHDPPLILIVDDEEDFRYAVRQMIGHSGRPYDIREAGDGVEGLASAREHSPDAIVLDLQMPVLDGFAVLDELAADPATRGIPVLISSSSVLDDTDRQRLARARAFLPKSQLTREAIRAALDSVLETRP